MRANPSRHDRPLSRSRRGRENERSFRSGIARSEGPGLDFPLLADPDHEVAEKYGVGQEKSQYGRTYMGIARTTYLIGADGKVQKRWDKVKVDDHAHEVIAALA